MPLFGSTVQWRQFQAQVQHKSINNVHKLQLFQMLFKTEDQPSEFCNFYYLRDCKMVTCLLFDQCGMGRVGWQGKMRPLKGI